MTRNLLRALAVLLLPCSSAWAAGADAPGTSSEAFAGSYSYANVDQFRTTHIDLALEVDFESRLLRGGAVLELRRLDPRASQLVLDTKDLTILEVTELTSDFLGATGTQAPIWISRPFHLGRADPILGSPLVIDMPASKQEKLIIRIDYETSPKARGLQWSVPTAHNPRQPPFLYTLSAPINARSWIPLQDTPRVRAPYSAHLHAPENLVALMAASADNKVKNARGEFWFHAIRPVPASAISLTIGDLRLKSTGPRTGVYADGAAGSAAAREFGDAEAMLKAAEKLLGPYPWQRFDIAVMPANFPVAEADGPDLVLVSPLLIAGDRSLVAPIAYALAHAWTGNLVTHTDWRDRWLGEAMAAYLAQRIVAVTYGAERDAEPPVPPGDVVLAADLQGRVYDDIFNDAQRHKGRLFFGWLEARAGRDRLDGLLRAFLERFAGQAVSTGQFVDFMQENLIDRNPGLLTEAELSAWLYDAAMPGGAAATPRPTDAAVAAFTGGDIKALQPLARQWSPAVWLGVLDAVPAGIGAARLADLDRAFTLSASANAEIASGWFALALRAGFRPAMGPLEKFLLANGELALIEPLYGQLLQTEDGAVLARRIYALARVGYHPFVARRLDEIVRP